jgi:Mce-associated membrane protein
MEGDAGARQLNPDDPIRTEAEESAPTAVDAAVHLGAEQAEHAPSSRLNSRGWLVGVCAALVVGAVALATGGYFALRSQHDATAVADAETQAVQAAKDCVAATQAPDTDAMAQSQAKIIECATGYYSVQASLYSGVLVEAYQAANAQVQVTDMRAAVERHHDDGSMDVLVALRVKLTNSEVQDQETGYRLRVQMAPDNGTYKIARLDQVTT